jgi:putative peptide zinc metalloprotease protein
MLPQAPGQVFTAQLERSVPAAARALPSAVLGSKGGGDTVVDPRDDKGLATLASVFEFELRLPRDLPYAQWLGSRVYVRFEHAAEPLGHRLWRGLRRAFLSQFKW